MGADLGAEAVLERRDDAAAVRVVLGVGRRHQHQVERQPDLVAPDLHVALLEHVQQADLDALGEVGELVDGEDPAVGARDEPVVDRELVGEVAALGDLDRVDLADEVGDRRVGRGELLAEPPVAGAPTRSGCPRRARPPAAGRAATPGAYGSSLISLPATIGVHSSSRLTSERMMRVFAWPRSPRKITSWPASSAFSSCGSTVSSKPMTPSTSGLPAAMRASAFARTSSLTGRDSQPLARSSPRVPARVIANSEGKRRRTSVDADAHVAIGAYQRDAARQPATLS